MRKYKLDLSFTFSRNWFPGHETAEEKISNRANPSKINTNSKNVDYCISTPFPEIECSWCWHLASECFISPLLWNHHSYRCCRNQEHKASWKITTSVAGIVYKHLQKINKQAAILTSNFFLTGRFRLRDTKRIQIAAKLETRPVIVQKRAKTMYFGSWKTGFI